MTKFAALLLALLAAAAQAKETGLAFVSSEKNNTLTMVDAKTLAVVGTIKTWIHRARRDMASFLKERGVSNEATHAVRGI